MVSARSIFLTYFTPRLKFIKASNLYKYIAFIFLWLKWEVFQKCPRYNSQFFLLYARLFRLVQRKNLLHLFSISCHLVIYGATYISSKNDSTNIIELAWWISLKIVLTLQLIKKLADRLQHAHQKSLLFIFIKELRIT